MGPKVPKTYKGMDKRVKKRQRARNVRTKLRKNPPKK